MKFVRVSVWVGSAWFLIAVSLSAAPTRAQQQFVALDVTYTATAANTSDSHYRVAPKAGIPANWRSPIDYASGRMHARYEIVTKPSTRMTMYGICVEGMSTVACMGYTPLYTGPGVYDFEQAFGEFWQYSMVDWTKGIQQLAFILKDETGGKHQADPEFYPTTVHVTITVLAPGAKYAPPADNTGSVPADAGTTQPSSAGRVAPPLDSGSKPEPIDASTKPDAASEPPDSAAPDTHAPDAAPTGRREDPIRGTDADVNDASDTWIDFPASAVGSSPAPAPAPGGDVSGGCAVSGPSGNPGLGAMWLVAGLALVRRRRLRRGLGAAVGGSRRGLLRDP